MSNAEVPQLEGPLQNPDWTDEENRRFDTLDQGAGFPMNMARQAALRLTNEEVSEAIRTQELVLPDSPKTSKAQKTDPPGLYDKQTPKTSNRINETPEDSAAREQAMRDRGLSPAA